MPKLSLFIHSLLISMFYSLLSSVSPISLISPSQPLFLSVFLSGNRSRISGRVTFLLPAVSVSPQLLSGGRASVLDAVSEFGVPAGGEPDNGVILSAKLDFGSADSRLAGV